MREVNQVNNGNPLLTICVPTYNRSDYLEVMLQALLPQAARHREAVEILILDNASPDSTPQIVEQAESRGPFRYIRNADNIGPVANIVQGARDHASGEYVWILGDHNLMSAGVLDHIVETIGNENQLDLFYVNYRCATYPDQWPDSADGGYDGPCDCVGNEDLTDRHVPQWHELLDPKNAMGTQLYVHIVRTEIWRDYWAGQQKIGSHQDGPTTYPHTYMIADTSFQKPAYYIGDPAVTIFNGAQSWGDIPTKTTVFLKGLPELIDLFARRGLSGERLSEARRFSASRADRLLAAAFASQVNSSFRVLIRMFRIAGLKRLGFWRRIWTAYVSANRSLLPKLINSIRDAFSGVFGYLFHHCRPARWLRTRSQK